MKLKPCPFCGSRAVEVCDVGSAYTVICRRETCRAMGPMADYTDIRQTRGAGGRKLGAKAARLWNARSAT